MLSFASAVGNLFNRVGKLGAMVSTTNSFQQILETDMINISTGAVAQYNSESDLQAEVGSSYINILGSLEGACSTAQQLSQDTFNRMTFRDNALINQTLTSGNTLGSVNEVIRQMGIAGATILAMNVTSVSQVFTSTQGYFANPNLFSTPSNGVIVSSPRRPLDGRVMENAFAETITITCTADSYTGNAIAFNEPATLTGQGAETDLFAFDWPLGSNCSTQLSSIDGDTSNGSNNLLTNSGWTSWSGGLPNGWTIPQGAGIVSQSTTIIFSPGSSLLVSGDGTTAPQIVQPVLGQVTPQTQYSFCVWIQRGGTPATGTLLVQLVDGFGNVVADNASIPNQLSINLSTLSAVAWQPYTVAFRTPSILPQSISIQYLFSVAPNAGSQVYLDKGGMGIMTQAYTGGTFFSWHGGSVPANIEDYNFSLVTNSRGAGGTLNTWQTQLYRLLDPIVASNEILFPSSNVPNISDTLLSP